MTGADELELFEAAVALAKLQADDGEGVAAAALTEAGHTLRGIWVEAMVDSACLCAETGPICEAQRTGDRIVASICVRWTEFDGPTVLAACGLCQERLAVFGVDVLVGVRDEGRRGFAFVPLRDLRPHAWWDAVT